jgi:hypothetical protein
MKKSRPAKNVPKPIQVEDALRSLTAGVGQLDGDRAAAYGELSVLRSARQSSLERRERIYAVKYGASDRRVQEMQKQRETNIRLRQEIYAAHTQAALAKPKVDENGYVFYGFVRNRQRQPLSRLTVALYDKRGQWQREFGYGCTDENGHFLLRLQGDAKSVLEEPKEGAATGRNSTSSEIRVYNVKQILVHRGTKPLAPQLGGIDYREIILDDCEESCAAPPGLTDEPPPPAPDTPLPTPRVPAARVTPSAPAAAQPPPHIASTSLVKSKATRPKTGAKLPATGSKDFEAPKKTKTEKRPFGTSKAKKKKK